MQRWGCRWYVYQGYFNVQELPSVGTNTSTIDVMWIPRPNRIETFGIEIECSFQSGGVMKAEVGAKPVDDPWFGHTVRGPC